MVHDERRRPTLLQKVHQWVMVIVIPVIVVPLVAWVLLAVVEAQKEIVSLKLEIAYVQRDIQKHNTESQNDTQDMGKIHHTDKVVPCTGCHKR